MQRITSPVQQAVAHHRGQAEVSHCKGITPPSFWF